MEELEEMELEEMEEAEEGEADTEKPENRKRNKIILKGVLVFNCRAGKSRNKVCLYQAQCRFLGGR